VRCLVVDLDVELDVAGSAFKDSIRLHRLKYLPASLRAATADRVQLPRSLGARPRLYPPGKQSCPVQGEPRRRLSGWNIDFRPHSPGLQPTAPPVPPVRHRADCAQLVSATPGRIRPGGQQPYPLTPAPRSPGAATGIIAEVLSGLGGLANVVGGLLATFGLAAMISESTYDIGSGAWTGLIVVTMLNIVAGVLLSIGTVMLLLRKMTSRWIVVAGCAVSIVSSLISLSLASTIAEYQYGGKGADVVGLVFPTVTIVLALLPATAASIRAKENGAPHPPYRG
jgi:hypothetical protein